jgi:CubicO group peptidase (beta-lactamase class C family)
MKIEKLLFPSLLFCTVLALTVRLFGKPASAKPASNGGAYDEIDAYVEGEMRRLNIPGVSLAVVEGDQIVHLRGFGRARPGGEAPAPQTLFFIGSLTKSFTANEQGRPFTANPVAEMGAAGNTPSREP